MRRGLVLWAAAQLIGAVAAAQRPKVETFGIDDGLPSATIADLAQDATGRIWILSRAGVAVYDGRNFESIDGTGLSGEVLAALEVDAAGRAWTVELGSQRVFFLGDGSWQALPPPPLLRTTRPFPRATALAVDAGADQDEVLLGTTDSGLLRWDGAQWSRVALEEGLPDLYVTCLATRQDEVFVGTVEGLCRLDASGLDCGLRDIDPRLSEEISAVFAEPEEDRLWILGVSWLGELSGGRFRVVAEGIDRARFDMAILGDIAVDSHGGVFFGSPAKTYFLEPESGDFRVMGHGQGLATEGLTSILIDRERNVWLGSLRGLSKISSLRFVSYDRIHGLLENEVTAIVELAPERYLLGHNAGLTFFEEGRVETLPFDRPENERNNTYRVLDLQIDHQGTVWAAAHNLGLLRIARDRSWRVVYDDEPVFAVEIDGEGQLWMATHKRLFRLRGDAMVEVDTGYPTEVFEFMRWIDTAPDGRLFVASRMGVLVHRDGEWTLVSGPSNSASSIFKVLSASDGKAWVGTSKGVFWLVGERLERPDSPALSFDEPVYFLVEDLGGRIWIGTDNGVRVWDGERARHLSVQHGLAGRETNRGAGLLDSQGRIWIGTDQGLSLYREEFDFDRRPPPVVEIRSLEAAGGEWSLDEPLTLPQGDTTLKFQIATIAFSRESPIAYRYRLQGFDADWIESTSLTGSELRYTNVPPGRYRFEIMASWSGDVWGDPVASRQIHIPRPFWRHPGFYVLLAGLVAGLVFLVYSLRTRAIRRRNRELEELTARLEETVSQLRVTRDQREALIEDLESKNAELERFTYTVSHDLKSPLVTIKGFLGFLKRDTESGDTQRVQRDIEKISAAAVRMGQLLDELLELSRVGRVVHEPEEIALRELAQEAVDTVASGAPSVDFEIQAELPVVWGDRVRILEVVQNLVDNAVKFMGEQSAPRVEIGLAPGVTGLEDGFVQCYVADNGVGIDPRYHETIFGLFDRLDPQVEGTGVGLALVRRIIEIHGGRIWVESEGSGSGARFCFTLPLAADGGRQVDANR